MEFKKPYSLKRKKLQLTCTKKLVEIIGQSDKVFDHASFIKASMESLKLINIIELAQQKETV